MRLLPSQLCINTDLFGCCNVRNTSDFYHVINHHKCSANLFKWSLENPGKNYRSQQKIISDQLPSCTMQVSPHTSRYTAEGTPLLLINNLFLRRQYGIHWMYISSFFFSWSPGLPLSQLINGVTFQMNMYKSIIRVKNNRTGQRLYTRDKGQVKLPITNNSNGQLKLSQSQQHNPSKVK